MIPNFVQKKFAGVQQPLGRWILRHICEFIALSPAILVTWIWLKARGKEILIVGRSSSSITAFLMPLDPELRRRSKTLGELEKLIVLNLSPDANSQIRIMYDRVVRIIGAEKPALRRVFWWASKLGGLQFPKLDILEAQNDPLWHTGVPAIGFTQSEVGDGEHFLRTIGVSEKQKIICLTTRTENYYLKLIDSGNKLKPQTVRNPDEGIYFEVARELSLRGYFVIRMGKDLATSVPIQYGKHIFDYAGTSRSEFLDAYILSRAEFLVNGGTGMFVFRAILNLPSVQADLYRVLKNKFFGDVCLFQKVRFVGDGRLATVSEMVKMGDAFSDERHQEKLGVELVKNTAEEILAACEEMIARLNGTWESTEEDEILQTRYWDLICKSGHNGGRIGAKFLRDNQDLLR